MRRLASLLPLLMLSLLLGDPNVASAQPSAPPLPKSMAAIGDSMTQATNVCCWYGDHPANSWSTGAAWWDGVSSHFERLRAVSPGITAYNAAVSGARMSDAPAQAQQAAARRVHYVTILMGANDLCTSSPETMTAVESFRTDFHQTLDKLNSALPSRARIFVSSIPDVYQLWSIDHTYWPAQLVWGLANICQSLLSPSRTEEQRQLVRERNIAFNTVLQEECATYERCRFDNNAVFNFQFKRNDVSLLDYFHPSLSGAAEVANLSWARTWWC
jgi:lysophospholipase L1-like esterase